jgi:hypothetical protein
MIAAIKTRPYFATTNAHPASISQDRRIPIESLPTTQNT